MVLCCFAVPRDRYCVGNIISFNSISHVNFSGIESFGIGEKMAIHIHRLRLKILLEILNFCYSLIMYTHSLSIII